MKNTLENKSKFFAHYWGQKILIRDLNKEKLHKCKIHNKFAFALDYICLTPLQQISDEDALWFASYIWISDFIKNRSSESIIKKTKEVIERNQWSKTSKFVDGLRLRGYAVDWNGLSVEKQVEYGWVKLKGK